MGEKIKGKKRDFSIASWNVNSVRLRKELIASFIKKHQPDFLALQEIKCLDEDFPADYFIQQGYPHQLIHGQKAYHGVALLSKHPFVDQARHPFAKEQDKPAHARHIFGAFQTPSGIIGLHNFYVPSGGGIPDQENNPKFDHKLRFVRAMEKFFTKNKLTKTILVGDLNIAPEENDVWSHEKLKNSIGHSPAEIEHLNRLREKAEFIDIGRHFTPTHKKLYSWWSYRTKEWREHDYGWRLDHIWTSKDLLPAVQNYKMHKSYRGRKQPSDHAPIVMEITL